MEKEYDKMAGKTVERVEDVPSEDCEIIKIIFTDGTSIRILGVGSGDYVGLFYKFSSGDMND